MKYLENKGLTSHNQELIVFVSQDQFFRILKASYNSIEKKIWRFYSNINPYRKNKRIFAFILFFFDQTAIFRFNNIEFLENNDNYIFYFYMIAGIIETYLGEELNRDITCRIIDISVSIDKVNFFVDMSISIE